jgi:hypothetical protein
MASQRLLSYIGIKASNRTPSLQRKNVMYNAQPKLSLDSLLGGTLLLGGVAWTVMTMAFLPAPAAPAGPETTPSSAMIAIASSPKFTGEVTSFPSSQLEVVVDKKYA